MTGILSQAAALLLLMLFGLAAVRRKVIGEAEIHAAYRIVLHFSLPCLMIAKLQQRADPQQMAELWDVFWMGGLSMLVCGCAAALVFRNAEPRRKAVLMNMAMFSNTGFMGFPVLTAVYDADRLIYGVIYVAIFNLLNWSLGPMLFDRRNFRWQALLNPAMVAGLAGILLFLCPFRLPDCIFNALELMGNTTTPLALFIVGARLSHLRLSELRDPAMLCACALRLIVLPLLVYAFTALLGASDIVQGVIVLCTAMPCAATLTVQAASANGDTALASQAVALSTALSRLTIPLAALLMA